MKKMNRKEAKGRLREKIETKRTEKKTQFSLELYFCFREKETDNHLCGSKVVCREGFLFLPCNN
jgi:hypothetical protein